MTLTVSVSSAVSNIFCQLDGSESTINTKLVIAPSATVIVISAVIDSYLACSNLEPLDTGLQVAVSPALKLPSAIFVQSSIGTVTTSLFPRTSILVVLMYTMSSAVIDVEDATSSRLCISPCPTVISIWANAPEIDVRERFHVPK